MNIFWAQCMYLLKTKMQNMNFICNVCSDFIFDLEAAGLWNSFSKITLVKICKNKSLFIISKNILKT